MKRVLFWGADRFSALSFASFLKHCKNLEAIEVITNQAKSQLATVAGINPVHLCPLKSLSGYNFDFSRFSLGIVSSFALFIPPRIISELPLINIHPSLLPRWRGPAPIQYTILNGDSKAGVSLIDLHPKEIDAGNLLLQKEHDIVDNMNYLQLEEELAELGGRMAAEVVDNFENYWAKRWPQPVEGITKTRKLRSEDGIVSFSFNNNQEIYRKFLSFGHQVPIKARLTDGRRIILEQPVLSDKPAIDPHYYDRSSGTLFITANNTLIGFKSFKVEGKSTVFSAGSFYANFLKGKGVAFV